MNDRKLVYILILNWNNWRDTSECIKSCLQLSYPYFRIILIDNGSTDESAAVLHETFPNIELIQTGRNLGYAAGINAGIRFAISKNINYIWLLNNDTVVDINSLHQMVNAYSNAANVGFIGSKILNYHTPELVDYLGGRLDHKTAQTTHLLRGEADPGAADHLLHETDFVTGCSMFFNTELINYIGFMDERFFLYYEDVDWNIKARIKGFSNYVCPSSVVYHKVHTSTRKVKGSIAYYSTRNALYFLENVLISKGGSWPRRFALDLKRLFYFLCQFNLRAIVFLIRGYISWLQGYQGKMDQPVRVRKNIFSVVCQGK
jgi:GT2 family glycosyltransferase